MSILMNPVSEAVLTQTYERQNTEQATDETPDFLTCIEQKNPSDSEKKAKQNQQNEARWRRQQKQREEEYLREVRELRKQKLKKFYKKKREQEQLAARYRQGLLRKEIYQKGVEELERIRGDRTDKHDVRMPKNRLVQTNHLLMELLDNGFL